MTLPTILRKKQIDLVPFLQLPILLSDKMNHWYFQHKASLPLLIKYCCHFLGNIWALLLLPACMVGDLLVGISAAIMLPFTLKHRVRCKQHAWNCLICGILGPVTALFQIARRMILPSA